MSKKIEEIKNLLSTLSRESLLIWGQHLWNLRWWYTNVPEIKPIYVPGTRLVVKHPDNERIAFLDEKRRAILDELWVFLDNLYTHKVFGDGKIIPHCLGNHLLSKDIGKYTRYDDVEKKFSLVLPDEKIIYTIWNRSSYVKEKHC